MQAKNRGFCRWGMGVLIMLVCWFGCAKKVTLQRETVEFFSKLLTKGSNNPECGRFYKKSIKPAIKTESPEVLERVYQYTGQTEYSTVEMGAILRMALLEKAYHVNSMEEAQKTLQLLAPMLNIPEIERSLSFTKIKTAPDYKSFSALAKTMTFELAELCLLNIDSLRKDREEEAEQTLLTLRFLILSLPESESEVVNITRILWDELNVKANDIQLDKVRELLKGAFPLLQPQQS